MHYDIVVIKGYNGSEKDINYRVLTYSSTGKLDGGHPIPMIDSCNLIRGESCGLDVRNDIFL